MISVELLEFIVCRLRRFMLFLRGHHNAKQLFSLELFDLALCTYSLIILARGYLLAPVFYRYKQCRFWK